MTYGQLRSLVQVRAETILETLTQQQFLHPHRAIGAVLRETLPQLGASVKDGATVMDRLGLDPEIAVGRLRRTEITQLSRALHRQARHGSDNPD